MDKRVAIVGAGPSGFYAAEHILKDSELHAQVDLFDRLPSPFGLVRGGVAPADLDVAQLRTHLVDAGDEAHPGREQPAAPLEQSLDPLLLGRQSATSPLDPEPELTSAPARVAEQGSHQGRRLRARKGSLPAATKAGEGFPGQVHQCSPPSTGGVLAAARRSKARTRCSSSGRCVRAPIMRRKRRFSRWGLPITRTPGGTSL